MKHLAKVAFLVKMKKLLRNMDREVKNKLNKCN